MTREEFDRIPLREQVRMIQDSAMWDDISWDYEICLVSELDEYIGEGVIDCFEYSGWRELLAMLSDLKRNIENTPDYDYVFRPLDISGWDSFRPLTNTMFSAILNQLKSDPSYKEFFEPEHTEEVSFDGLEELI